MGRRKPRRTTTRSVTTRSTSAMTPEQTSQADSSRLLNLAQEYHYVITDLQRTGIIAAVLIFGLVILSFILR
jgi:hypothetical protein